MGVFEYHTVLKIFHIFIHIVEHLELFSVKPYSMDFSVRIQSKCMYIKKTACVAGQVMYAEIKMENGKSKGCGTVRFDSPESAEQACRMMNGTKINGREVDVRIDRNA